MLRIPKPIQDKLDELENLVEDYPLAIPVNQCAEFLGMNPEGLRCAIESGQCPFGLGWKKQDGGYRAFKIPTVTFYMWYTGRVIQ